MLAKPRPGFKRRGGAPASRRAQVLLRWIGYCPLCRRPVTGLDPPLGSSRSAIRSPLAPGHAVKNRRAEVSHSPSRIENRIPPAAGNAQPGNRLERTSNTFATTAP
jgi:hypothetical protein